MKAIIILILVLVTFSEVFAQSDKKRKKVKWEDWSDSLAFFSGPEPIIRGEGVYSDSLSLAHNGKTFFEADGVYFVINSVADYYLWFTSKYPFLFKAPTSTYKFYYKGGDNYSMANYIAFNYSGRKIPLKFARVNEARSIDPNSEPTMDARKSQHAFERANRIDDPSKAYKPAKASTPAPKVSTPRKN